MEPQISSVPTKKKYCVPLLSAVLVILLLGCANQFDPRTAAFVDSDQVVAFAKTFRFAYSVAIPTKIPMIRANRPEAELKLLKDRRIIGITYSEERDGIYAYDVMHIRDITGTAKNLKFTYNKKQRGDDEYIWYDLGTFVPNEVSLSRGSSDLTVEIRGHLVDLLNDPSLFGLNKNNVIAKIYFEEDFREGGERVYVIKKLGSIHALSGGFPMYRRIDEIAAEELVK